MFSFNESCDRESPSFPHQPSSNSCRFQGKDVQYYHNGLFNLKTRDGINFMKNNMSLFIDEIRTWDGFEMITDKLEGLIGKFEAQGSKVYQKNFPSDGYNVLNHGDFHINNMVFKKDSEGQLTDVLFVS